MGVTFYGEAELYSTASKEFIGKISHLNGPFRSLGHALFYDRRSVVLVLKHSSVHDEACPPNLKIIPDLAQGSPNAYFSIEVEQPPETYPRYRRYSCKCPYYLLCSCLFNLYRLSTPCHSE